MFRVSLIVLDLIVIKYLPVALRETRVKFTREGKAAGSPLVNNLIKALNALRKRKRGTRGWPRLPPVVLLVLRGTMTCFALCSIRLSRFIPRAHFSGCDARGKAHDQVLEGTFPLDGTRATGAAAAAAADEGDTRFE